jgi:hypothetical protein
MQCSLRSNNKRLKRLAITALAFLTACGPYGKIDPEDPNLARVDDEYLRLSQVREVVPQGIGPYDSAAFVYNYINNWIQQKVLLREARKNLSAHEQDFSRQLDEYRNSLMLFALDQKLVRLYLDTNVSDLEIERYYHENKTQFELKGNIVKFDLVRVPARSRHLREFRRLLQSDRPADLAGLEEYCKRNATDYWLAKEWVFFEDLLNELPEEPQNEESFLRRTRFTELEDSLYKYMLRINDFKTIDSLAPLAVEKQNIKNLILNARKIRIVQEKRQEITNVAIQSKQAEIYHEREF